MYRNFHYAGDHLAGDDFHSQETGTYKLNSDYTGSMVINLIMLNTPPPHGLIDIKFVISNGGRHPRSRIGVYPAGIYGGRAHATQRRRLEGRVGAGRRRAWVQTAAPGRR